MNFLVDNQLPKALCNFLAAQGHRSSHVLGLGMDEDFLHLANRPGDTGKLLWVRIGNCRKQTLLRAFEREISEIVRAFDEGIRIVEILSSGRG